MVVKFLDIETTIMYIQINGVIKYYLNFLKQKEKKQICNDINMLNFYCDIFRRLF